MTEMMTYFSEIPDRREAHKCRHLLSDILIIGLCTYLSSGQVNPVIDIMMSGASATTNYHLDKIFLAAGRCEQYIRIQPDSMGNANSDIDDAFDNNLRAIAELGTAAALRHDADLNHVADILLDANPDPVRFT